MRRLKALLPRRLVEHLPQFLVRRIGNVLDHSVEVIRVLENAAEGRIHVVNLVEFLQRYPPALSLVQLLEVHPEQVQL